MQKDIAQSVTPPQKFCVTDTRKGSMMAALATTADALYNLPIVRDLLSCAQVQRLDKIRFLGAIDFFDLTSQQDRGCRRASRLDHSMGVASLALQWARKLLLSSEVTNNIVAAALLHDIGQGPLSHSSEYFFANRFGLTHHIAAEEIFQAKTAAAQELIGCLHDHKIFYDATQGLAPIFSGPINVDNIDGICRSADYFGLAVHFPKSILVSVFDDITVESLAAADDFWRLKEQVYKLIYNEENSLRDAMIAYALEDAKDTVSRNDFGINDDDFEDKFNNEINRAIEFMQVAPDALKSRLIQSGWLKDRKAQLQLTIDPTANLKSFSELTERYKQRMPEAPWLATHTSRTAKNIPNLNLRN